MGESPRHPLYTTQAHVFKIDPATKKSWIPISKQAVTISYYFDNSKSSFKILSIDGGKAIINCTLTNEMVFTKTSQKFGQWADVKANTVYGLGFKNEYDLCKFSDKFNEVKGSVDNTLMSPDGLIKNVIITPPLTLHGEKQLYNGITSGGSVKSISSNSTGSVEDAAQSPGSHRSSSSSSESQMKYENDRLKKALAQSSANTKKWESEFQTLKNNNARLTAALQESAVNVEKWKEQLNNYKEDNARLRKKQSSSAIHVNNDTRELEQRLHETEIKLKRKEEEINRLSQHSSEELHMLREKNNELVRKVQILESEKKQHSQTDKNKSSETTLKLNQVNDIRHEMELKLRELTNVQHKMNSLFKNS